ncbi:MAG: hypothetical protein MIO92_08855 [Methanosarcinaceae archaeon]|nr:hypothetical protein [Methanosarcinaceae archaeon]
MSFENHWEDYHFRQKCGLNVPQFYRTKTFDFKEVKKIAKFAYMAGLEDKAKLNTKEKWNVFSNF